MIILFLPISPISDRVSVNVNANDAIALGRIVMKIGYFHDIQPDGNVACMLIGQS